MELVAGTRWERSTRRCQVDNRRGTHRDWGLGWRLARVVDLDWCKDLLARRQDTPTATRRDRELVSDWDSELVLVKGMAWGCHRDSGQLSGTQRVRRQILVKSIQTNQTLLRDMRHLDYYKSQDPLWFEARMCSKSHRATALACCNSLLDNRCRTESHLTC